jgi:hypothetical protein
VREKDAADGSFKLRFLSDGVSGWNLEADLAAGSPAEVRHLAKMRYTWLARRRFRGGLPEAQGKWAVFVTRINPWVSNLLRTRTATGLKLSDQIKAASGKRANRSTGAFCPRLEKISPFFAG